MTKEREIDRERRELREWIEGKRDHLHDQIIDRRRETQAEIEAIRDRYGEVDALSGQGAQFIAHFEGVVLHGYNDPVGHCTIGAGHLIHHGNCSTAELARTVSRDEALKMLVADAKVFAAAVLRSVGPELTQAQLDALISFAYNNGIGAFQGSTLLRRLNAGEDPNTVVRAELPKWVLAGSPPRSLPGLVARRAAEVKLFTTGRYA